MSLPDFASVEQQLVPEYRDKPMGVLPLDSPYSGCIAVSREAKALGIKRGARPIDLRKQYQNFPTAIARHDVYIRMHHRILEIVGSCLPIRKVWSIDEVECTLCAHERKNWQSLAHKIQQELIHHIGPYVTPSIGFGPNQVLAKIAAEMEKPNGLVRLHPDDLPHSLYKIELSDIPGIGQRMKHRLHMAGIGSVRQLMKLSGKQMRALWRSVEGERLWAGLHGYRLSTEETTRRMFGHGRILSPDWRNVEGVRNCTRTLLVKAARRLRRAGYAAQALKVSIGFQDHIRLSEDRKFTLPAFDDRSFFHELDKALELMWQKMADQMHIKPFKVSICLYGLVPVQARTEDLLEGPNERTRRQNWENISHMLDQLNTEHARTIVSFGTHIEPPGGYTGGKIAFGRIPDMRDFI
jgi:DNA polymerase-4